MSLSALERRELLAFAATFEGFAENPDMVRRFAEALRAWTAPRCAAEAAPGAAPVQLELAPRPAPAAPPSEVHAISAAPSSSSDLRDQEDQKKTVQRGVRPGTDDPLPDDFRAVYAEVVAERGVMLPSADYTWASFVEHLADKDLSFSRRSSLKRKWRSWCRWEQPIAEVDTPACGSTLPQAGGQSGTAAPTSPQRAVHEESTAVLEAQRRAAEQAAPPALAAELARRALEELTGRNTQGAERGASGGSTPARGDDPRERGRRESSPAVSASPASPTTEPPCPLEIARQRARAALPALDADEDLEAVLRPMLARGGGLRAPPEPRAMSA